jgi:hypothetical protein
MVAQSRIQKMDWVGGKSFAGARSSLSYSPVRRRAHLQKFRELAKSSADWKAYSLMAVGAGCILAAFFQNTQVHPWLPLLLGWAGTMAILRGILCKGSHKA